MKNANRKPVVAHNDGQELTATGTNDSAASVAIAPKTVDLFASVRAVESDSVQAKTVTMQVARQKLAQAADLYKEGGSKSDEADAIAADAAGLLYQARAAGKIDANEVSGVLGDIFGYVPKKDGTPGKTPDKQGGAIRKRVVRAVEARQYVNGEDASRFFEGLPVDAVAAIVERLDIEGDNRLSIWSAYDLLGKLKTENAARTNPAFDPKRIAAITASLGEEGGPDIVRNSPELIKAYAALVDVLDVIRMVPVEQAA